MQSKRRGSVPLEQTSATVPPHAATGSLQYQGVTVHQLRTNCHYMSPATLRLGIERLVQVTVRCIRIYCTCTHLTSPHTRIPSLYPQSQKEHGEQALYRETMLELCPDLFWNLFWYSARFNLPLPLPSRTTTTTTASTSEAAAVTSAPQMLLLAGWDAGVVERGAQAAVAALYAFQEQRMAEG